MATSVTWEARRDEDTVPLAVVVSVALLGWFLSLVVNDFPLRTLIAGD